MDTLEVCVSSVKEAETALACGADSVELCLAPEVGGLTFRALEEGEIARLEALGKRIRLLIRLRPGSFCYTEEEVAIMCHQIKSISALLPQAGFTIGALTPSGSLDRIALERLIKASQGAELTFHRGIDILVEPWRFITEIRDLGFERLLTSGGTSTAYKGVEAISLMQREAGDKLTIVAAGGIRAEHINLIRTECGIHAFHGGFRGVRAATEGLSVGRPADGSYLDAWWEDSYLDRDLVSAALKTVKAL